MIGYMPTDYRKLLILPLILFIFCVSVIGFTYFEKGYIFEKSIDFEGGTEASVLVEEGNYDIYSIEKSAKETFGDDTTVRLTHSSIGTSINLQSKTEINLQDFEIFINNTGLNPIETDKDTDNKLISKRSLLHAGFIWNIICISFHGNSNICSIQIIYSINRHNICCRNGYPICRNYDDNYWNRT